MRVNDKNLAKVADINGNVIIGGKTVLLEDIDSYEQLQESGQAPPTTRQIQLRATSETNSIAEEIRGNHKVWVNTSLATMPLLQTVKNHPALHVEVCFRKKAF
jgi:hypothetical protein